MPFSWIKEREALLKAEIDRIVPQIENLSTKKKIERSSKLISRVLRQVYSSNSALIKMSYKDQRELVQRTFAGKDLEVLRLGVYVRKSDDPERQWAFTIRGILVNFEGQLPISELELQEYLGDEEGITNFAKCYRAADPPGCRFPPGTQK
jgi:hypothetical protein